MQVPEHLVSLYVATCGQNGPGLGSDEKEIILLVYVILEASSGRIIGSKQLLVRPDGSFVKDRTISTSSDTSTATATASSPPLAITYTTTTTAAAPVAPAAAAATVEANNNSCNISNNNSNSNQIINNINNSSNNNNDNNNNNHNNVVNSINNNNNNNNNTSTSATNTVGPLASTCITNTNSSNNLLVPIISDNNNNNNNNNINMNNNNINNAITNGPIGSIGNSSCDNIELPIAVAQAAGKPLREAIEEFDEYLRSLSLNDADDIKLITDGQLPLRQCLHSEACAKDIELPAYYNRFCDLRKEFLKFKSGDLSRALVPVKDIKKILQIPLPPVPQSIAEMIKELNIPNIEDADYYVRESRDMVSVIQTLLKGGHKFYANEIINLTLEPGICSIDDEIDGNCIVRARGLPWQSSDQDIAKFFRGLNVAKGGVALCLSPLGRRNGEALIRFISQEHRDMALKRHKHHIGNRYIEVYRATGDDFLAIAGGASNEAQAFLSKGAQVIIRMRGLPYDCTAKQVLDFFTAGDSPCNVLDGAEGVLFVKKPDGRATGDAFVLFASEVDAPKALSRHRESIGQRYIELFRSTTAEVQQVLNRSLDPKTYEANHQPPLIAQLPTMQLSLLPQHLITSGTTKNCIRLRGLPYEALVEHILHFLDDFAKHIIIQGVHMVINAQGQPSGEAFIQMDSEESARLCAQRKHNQFMVFGKKYRYIEVFQCSGDDMNLVLNGGLQSPVPVHHAHHPGGKQPPLLSPGASVIGSPFGPFAHFGPPPTTILASPHRAHHHHHHHHHHPHAPPHSHHPATFYPHPLVYWPYPSPPVSPTAYYGQSAHSPTHVTANQTMYSLDFLPAVTPTPPPPAPNYTTTPQTPMSPPNVAIPPTASAHSAAGLILSPTNKAPALALVTPPPPLPPSKQYSNALPVASPVTPIAGHAPPNFHHKIAPLHHIAGRPATAPSSPSGVQPQQQYPNNNAYHYNSLLAIQSTSSSSPSTSSMASSQHLVLKVNVVSATAVIPTTATTTTMTPVTPSSPLTQCLLTTVDAVQAECKPLLPPPKHINTTSNTTPAGAATTSLGAANQNIVPKQCVELYIS